MPLDQPWYAYRWCRSCLKYWDGTPSRFNSLERVISTLHSDMQRSSAGRPQQSQGNNPSNAPPTPNAAVFQAVITLCHSVLKELGRKVDFIPRNIMHVWDVYICMCLHVVHRSNTSYAIASRRVWWMSWMSWCPSWWT